jgi:hypothetical protein
MPQLRSLAGLAPRLARLTAAVLLLIASLSLPAWGAEIVAAPGPGVSPQVRLFDSVTGLQTRTFQAFDATFLGGVHVALSDVTGDGVPDLVVGTGPEAVVVVGPRVRVFDGVTGLEVRNFLAYDPAFTGGVRVAVGDVTGDGRADIVTGAGVGGQPHVKVFDGVTGLEVRSFLAYDPSFTRGVHVAAGDVNGDGLADIVTGAGALGLPHVRVFDAVTGLEVWSFLAYDPSFSAGVRVAAADVNGDGRADIITGPTNGTGPTLGSGSQPFPDVNVIDGATGMVFRTIFAFPASSPGGVYVAAGDLDGDGRAEVIAGVGAGIQPHVRVFDGATGNEVLALMPYDASFTGGVHVAAPVTGLVRFTSAAETTFTMGEPGTFTVTTVGMPAAALTQGGDTLPTGVTFTDLGDGTGTLEGTPGPGTAGTYALTFTADNGVAPPVVQNFTLTVAAVGSVTVLAATPNPSVVGEEVTLTATVTPATPDPLTPTGDVTFKDGTTVLGTATLDGLGQATLQTTTLPAGSRTLTAEYGGDGHFGPSTSAPVIQTVTAADTTTAVTSAANPSVFGQPVTFTATVTPVPPGGGVPTGTVTFTVDGTPQPPVTLDGTGAATLTTSTLAVGVPHTITAAYTPASGDYTASTSAVLTQTVTAAATTTAVASSTNPSVFGQPVTFTATVTVSAPGTGTPAGTVTFFVDAVSQGPITLNGAGQATLMTSVLTVGSHTISATYTPNSANFTGSSGALVPNQTVNQAATTTAVTSSANPSVFGQSVTFTATVNPVAPGAGTPTGTVTFSVDGTPQLPAVPLAGNQATFSTNGLAAGSRTITAVYSGDGNFVTSTSPGFTQTVGPAQTTTAVAGTPNPSVFGQQVTFTATVSAVAPGAGTPVGTVSFLDGATSLGPPVPLNGMAQAQLATTGLAPGPRSITAVYTPGTGNFAGSTSLAFTQTVNPAQTTTALGSSPNPSGFQETVTFTATVTVVAPGGGTPAGTVSFRDAGVEIGAGGLAGGVATFATSLLSVGSHTITAVYLGTPSHATSTSPDLIQVVQIVANPDAYAATGNIAITVPAPGVLGNDSNGGAGLTVFAPGTTATTGGGSVTLNANGSFTYDPPAGLTGGQTDTFTYQATDGAGTSNVATVTITLTDILWFVCDGCSSTNQGTLLNPFTSVGAFSAANTGAPPAPQPNDKIYIRSGTYDGASNTLALRNGQLVRGQGVAASDGFPGFTPAADTDAAFAALTAGSRPVISPTSGNGINVASGNDVQHLNVGDVAAGATKISGSSIGTLTLNNMLVTGATGTGRALDLGNGTLAVTLEGVTSTDSSTTGITLTSVAGSLTVTGGTAITNPAGVGIDLSSTAAALTFGNTAVSGSGGTGVQLASNSGAIGFGALDISPDAGQRALHATANSGTIGTTSGTLATTNAVVVEITGGPTTLAMTLTSVSAAGGTSNIVLGSTAGTLTMNGGALSGATGRAVDIVGGTGSITYAGTISNAGTGLGVANKTGGTVTFGGSTKTLSTGASTAVTLSGNTGATIDFTNGGLDIDTTSGTGFSATTGGTVNVGGSNNTISTTTGTAANLNGVGGALSWLSIAANGAANGIVLTGTTGSFTVTGDGTTGGGGLLNRNASGGTIQNTTDDCVRLTTAQNVTLRQMDFLTCGNATTLVAANGTNSTGEHAVEVIGGSNVVLSAITVNNPAVTGVLVRDVGGTNRIDNNSLITHIDARNVVGGIGHGVYVLNTNVDMTLFEFRSSRITNNAVGSGSATFFVANGGTANMQADVLDSIFDDLSSQALTMSAGGVVATTGTLTSNVINNDFLNAKGVSENNLGVLVTNGATHVALAQSNLFENIAKDGTVANTSIVRTQNSGGKLTVTLQSNTIQNIAYGAGAGGRHVIGHIFEPVTFDAANFTDITIDDNTASNVTYTATNREFIFIDYRATASGGNVTVTNNNFDMPTAGSQQMIELRFRQTNASTVNVLVDNNGQGTGATGTTSVSFLDVDSEAAATVNATITNNDFTNTNGAAGFSISVANESATSSLCANITGNVLSPNTIQLDEAAGTMTVTQGSEAALEAANGGANATVTGTPIFGAGTCATPP